MEVMNQITSSERDLLEYYKQRVDAFDEERAMYVEQVQQINVGAKHTETYKLKWANSKKQEQIEELQKALSDAHMYLYEERDHVLRLSSENDELRTQEMEDRKRIQHLLALTQPVSQEVTYFRDCRPITISRAYPNSRGGSSNDNSNILTNQSLNRSVNDTSDSDRSANLSSSSQERRNSPRRVVLGENKKTTRSNKMNNTLNESKMSIGDRSIAASKKQFNKEQKQRTGGGQQIVRTIYMPNESVSVLKMIIQSLRKQLEEQQELNQQRAQALLEDRLIKESEYKERVEEYKSEIKQYDEELLKVKELYQSTTKDYLLLRHESQKREKSLQEEVSKERTKCEELNERMSILEQKTKKSMENVHQNSEEYVEMFRKQTYTSEENLNIIKDQYFSTQELFEKRCAYLEGRLNTYKNKYDGLERRRRLESEGYQNDFRTVRTKLQTLERLFINQFSTSQNNKENNFKSSNNKNNDMTMIQASEQLKVIKDELERIFLHMNDKN